MGTKSRERVLQRLRHAEAQRGLLVKELAKTSPLVIGSFSVVMRRCGKPSCHCAERPGHAQAVLMTVADDGRRRCQLVRQADVARVREAVERYRTARDGLRRLGTMDSEILAVLKELMRLRDEGYD